MKDETINSVQIPAPKFDLSEAVILEWNGQTAKGQITDRRYCFDGDVWEYQISGGQYAIADYITPREGNSEE